MHKIYADTDVCSWILNQINLEPVSEITGNPAVFHMPFKYSNEFESKIRRAVDTCNLVVILMSELHPDTISFLINNQHPKIKYFTCGVVQGYHTRSWMDWFITTTDFYKKSNLLSQLSSYSTKPKYFDILLGWSKPHRQKIYDFVNSNSLNDKVIMTYLQDRSKSLQEQSGNSWIWPTMDVPLDHFQNTITNINYNNHTLSLSQLIPIDIYNQTAYSVVAETNWDNHYSFYTEKIVKPILAERLFLVFSGQYYLRNLRSLGFKTFNGIIDESYDDIENNNQRFDLALQQLKYLLTQPQEKILEQIRYITQHNKSVMLETAWLEDFFKELQALLLEHVEQN